MKRRMIHLLTIAIAVAVAHGAAAEKWVSLFDGKDLDGWVHARDAGKAHEWTVEKGTMTNVAHGEDIATKKTFTDFELKIEYKTVRMGNSGVYLRGRIELQVFDSNKRKKPGKADDGAIFGQTAPLINATKPAGKWTKLHVRCVGDRVTATLNGKTIHDNQLIPGVTGGAQPGGVTDPGPLMLQGDHGKVWYRNIKIRPIAPEKKEGS